MVKLVRTYVSGKSVLHVHGVELGRVRGGGMDVGLGF